MAYTDIYQKRLNRFGFDYQSRVQGQREKEFEEYLLKSVYRVDFKYDEKMHPGTLEPYKEDELELIGYLLTRVWLDIPNGTILMLPDKKRQPQPWMIWWLETMKASGYNRYIVLKVTTELIWDDEKHWGYLRGPGDAKIRDTIRSKTAEALYTENENLYMFVAPADTALKKDTYIEVAVGETTQAFTISGLDFVSTPGVMYVSLDPVYVRDNSDPPEQKPSDPDEDFYWLTGGGNGGT